MTLITYKSIDELVEKFEDQITMVSHRNIYEFLVWNESHFILATLRNKTNIPSKHDLLLIQAINNSPKNRLNYSSSYDQWKSITNDILQIYKERKE